MAITDGSIPETNAHTASRPAWLNGKHATTYRRVLARPYFLGPALAVAAGVLIPLVYLLLRAFEAEPAMLMELLWRGRTLRLLGNTLLLAAGVLVVSTTLAFPLAWLATRTDLRGRGLATLLGVLPLTVPAYVMAYVLLASTGAAGTLADVFGVVVPRLNGFWGALLALSLTTFPYLFLNLRSAFQGLDPALEETARSLGLGPAQTFARVVVPQLQPALYAGALLVGLHVLGDFGVVSLMRFETFSFALYLQYSAAYDRIYAAWLALMLLGLAGGSLWLEARLLRGLSLYRTGVGAGRKAVPTALGRWRWAAYAYMALLLVATLVLPLTTVGYWIGQGSALVDAGELFSALGRSVTASFPAAVLAGLLALPLAYLGVRYPTPLTRGLERIAYIGYATPPLAFALAFVFFSLQTLPVVYQTLALLVVVYALHFLAEAIGPVRSALYQAPPRLEEAARSLGRSPFAAFATVTFPLLRRGLLVSIALVFLSAMKELPLTFLLSPIGFETLALGVWSYTREAVFEAAAPFALALIACSTAFVGLLLTSSTDPEKAAPRRTRKRADADEPRLPQPYA